MIDEMINITKNRGPQRQQHSRDKNHNPNQYFASGGHKQMCFHFSIVKQEIIWKSTDVLLIVLVICQF